MPKNFGLIEPGEDKIFPLLELLLQNFIIWKRIISSLQAGASNQRHSLEKLNNQIYREH